MAFKDEFPGDSSCEGSSDPAERLVLWSCEGGGKVAEKIVIMEKEKLAKSASNMILLWSGTDK